MIKLLEYIFAKIVDYPDELHIEEQKVEDGSFQYNISARQEDIGKIIGREGKIISAVRNVAKVLAIKENTHIRIEII